MVEAETVAEILPAPSLPADVKSVNVQEGTALIREWRAKQTQPADPDKPKVEPLRVNGRFVSADAPESTTKVDDAAPPQEATGETQDADPAEVPPLERPRSWSKDKEEIWTKLDRSAQEYVLEHADTTSSEIRRVQNEAAERTKALEAKEQAAENARQQYEAAAQNALQVLQQQSASDFPDIKTDADVMKLATEDPFRFSQWQARQMQIGRQAQQVEQLERQRQETESNTFKAWSKEQDTKFEKQFPEFADKEKVGKVREGITSYLTSEVGVPAETLPRLWDNPLFRDAMFQRVIYDASRFHAAQKAAKTAVAAPKPQVLRPGTTQRGAPLQEQIAAAQTRLKTAKGIEAVNAGVDLMRAKRAVRR